MPNPTVARDLARRKKIEAMRAEQRAHRRRRFTALGAGATVVVVVLALVLVHAVQSSKKSTSAATSAAAASVISDVTTVPESVLDAVGKGTIATEPSAINGAPSLTADGKPEVLYIGAEYCPFCAAERWAVAQALSRFGTFTGLGQTTSSSVDSYPNTPTLSFHGATYTSQYLTFRGYETTTNQSKAGGGYTALDTVPADAAAIEAKYDAAPYIPAADAGSIPFVDLGGKALISGASYSPQLLAGLTQAQVAADLQNASSPVAKAVLGTANAITAKLCDLTGNKPANVCTSAAVTAARAG